MKDYKRLTEEHINDAEFCSGCSFDDDLNGCEKGGCDKYYMYFETYERLRKLEDKISSGELCEQKTCKNISEKNPVDEFICSVCGFHYEDVSETREDEDGEYSYKVEFVTKYCPNCGGKVEDEE